jgi:hypothetical protein
MKIENIEVYGFRRSLYGMRNPLESWDKSDSKFGTPFFSNGSDPWNPSIIALEYPNIGENDLALACKLIKSGRSHRKFLRHIMIWWDITLPICLWSELDTYKVNTVRNSCSTMHKLGFKDLDCNDFQNREANPGVLGELNRMGLARRNKTTYFCQRTGKTYEGNVLIAYMKYSLPSGYLQKATYSFNYETAFTMYFDRKDHRMPEWSGPGGICEHLMMLPYFKEFYGALESKVK